jgi:cyclohexyl-isocyanide hydratase
MSQPPMQVNILLFPEVTQLDFTGPAQVFARMPNTVVALVAADPEPVVTDCGWSVVPSVSLDEAPAADVLVVPGGNGAFSAMLDPRILAFVTAQAASARFITSVCTGSFVLGAAGLLRGKRATSHWASLPMLEQFGALPTEERVVRDGDVVTGAGVSSGIDFAFVLAELLHGREVAERIQLQIEYDPQPPFAAGSARTAPADWVAAGRASAASARGALVDRAAQALHGR